MILITGNVAMKWAAVLNGSGSALSRNKLMVRCTGKNVSKNNPARAITNFLEIEENRILLIVSKKFNVYLSAEDREEYQK
jgi:hypothetical protein